YCNVVSNGTISLFLALKALDIKNGDEIIVPDYTMIATSNAVVMIGAKPVFVDVDNSLCLNTKLVKRAITAKTKAVIHVSINGRAGDLNNLKKLCRDRGIYLVEDAAQSLGSFHNGKHLGLFGEVGSFSFSAPKIITTGQGGALITDDRKIYEKIEKLKDFGRVGAGVDWHDAMGWNFKFTDLQAVLGIEQMKKLPERAKRKKAMLALYQKLLKDIKEIKFIETSPETSPWFIDVLVPNPKALQNYLKERKIGSRLFYPAIHIQPIYQINKGRFGKLTASNFPVATNAGNHGLWLPSSSFLTDSDIRKICGKIINFYKSNP
ncbi:MAG: DegT/DnrJ/EryC1/StrS family aminotransferase, partial [Proteobacteria bacterium]|nr:DegT/DnrJ/EryC1/StrS family aminotransferase [Pseudomonadota bacterium]